MPDGGFSCRHCGRRIVVPASKCPWCGQQIMVICSACKQYTDDQEPTCQHCGAALVPDRLESVLSSLRLDPTLAAIVADRQKARLVASGVVALYVHDFFFESAAQRSVLMDLFTTPPGPYRQTQALLFVAIAYLVQQGYCALGLPDEDEQMEWREVRRWDGQERSLEGALARQAALEERLAYQTLRQAVDRVVSEAMGFRFEVAKPQPLRAPGMSDVRVVDLSARSISVAVIEMARQTELPEHEEAVACRGTYALLLEFVRADPARARRLAGQIVGVVDWYRRYEADPTLALMRDM